jgi:methyl-accepting chemotaxis protein
VGSAGRGFAVIAQEIRSLSEQIEQATSKVTAEVTALQLD